MTVVMTAEEFARERGVDLAALEASIDEARDDAITKDTMNRDTLTARNMTAETEQFMRDYLRKAAARPSS